MSYCADRDNPGRHCDYRASSCMECTVRLENKVHRLRNELDDIEYQLVASEKRR